MADLDKPDLETRVSNAFEGLTADTFTSVEGYCAEQEVRVLTILLGDQVDSTRRTSEITNPEGMNSRDHFRKKYRDVLAQFPGQHIEYAGDAFLAVFASPTEAVLCAQEIQARYRESGAFDARIGLHDGEIVYREHQANLTGARAVLQREVFGREVNLCARVCELAEAGRVLLSRSVFDKARANIPAHENGTGPRLRWENWGAYHFKGIERGGRHEAYDVCEVALADAEGIGPPKRSNKSWPADSSDEVIGWRPAKGETVPGTNWQLEERLGRESGDEPGKERESSNFQGEFGEVWRAYNPGDKSHQVFKFCFKRAQLPALKREARLLKRLKQHRHRSLVEVYDVTEGDQPPHYLEMEYVAGPTMADWLASDPPLKERLTLMAEVADALDLVHEAGIFHRDIKPTNILLERLERGGLRAKLTDFGLGATEDPELLKSVYASKVEGVAGTWDFIAPELREGGKASPQSDIYSLGLTLYQVLQGNLNATRPTNLARAIEDPILIGDLERCLEDDPAKRWESAGELATALRSHEARLAQHHAEQEQARQRARAQRQRRVASVALLIAAIAIGFGGFAAIQWQEAREQRRVAEVAREQSEQRRSLAQRHLYEASIFQADTYLKEGRYELARQALWRAPVEHSGWEWGHLAQRLQPELLELSAQGFLLRSPSFSPDGARIVASCRRQFDLFSGCACIWDATTGELVHVLEGHTGGVSSSSFSPDGTLIVTASYDGTARVWDSDTGALEFVLVGHEGEVETASFSPDSMHILTGGRDPTPRVWDAVTGKLEHALEGDTGWATSAVYSLDGTRIVTVSNGFDLRVWDAHTGRALHVLEGHKNFVKSAMFSKDGNQIVTASDDGTARVWDVNTGLAIHALEGHEGTVSSATFSPDGTLIVTASHDGAAHVWDATTGEGKYVLEGHEDLVWSAHFSPDGRHIVTASRDRTGRIWDASSGIELFALRMHEESDVSAIFSPDGTRIVTASNERTLRIWDATTGEQWHTVELQGGSGLTASFSSDGTRIVTGGKSPNFRVWNSATGEELFKFEEHGTWVRSASYSPDGSQIVTASVNRAPRVWDAVTGEELLTLGRHEQPAFSASYSPDGSQIVTASSDRAAHVWDAVTGEELLVLEGHEGDVSSASYSPDGLQVVTAAYDETARVWDAVTGEELLVREDIGVVRSAAFSPDGVRIVTASYDHLVRIWDADTGTELQVLDGHEGSVWSAQFNPDGGRIVTASGDETARLWDAVTGEQILVIEGHDHTVTAASFSPDGKSIITASEDRTTRIWTAAPWRLEDLPPVEGTFDTPEEERKARFFEWKRQEYQRWLAARAEP